MTEHTHLSGIKVNGDEITFSFSQHEGQAVAGMSIPADANADRVSAQLEALVGAAAITHDQAREVADRSGLGDKLYTPTPEPKKDGVAADAKDVVGDKTAAYLASRQAQQDTGMSV